MMKTKFHYPLWETQTGSASAEHRGELDSLADVIAVTAEACGQPLSPLAGAMLADDLSHFDETLILAALARCRFELHGPLRIADVLSRIDDGRPDAGEAWSMMPANEHESVVWTEEMTQAWSVVLPLLEAGDVSATQTAFFAAYEKSVLEARVRHNPPRWTPSLGLDVAGRELALRDAVTKGRITAAQAEMLLGYSLAVADWDDIVQGDIKSLH